MRRGLLGFGFLSLLWGALFAKCGAELWQLVVCMLLVCPCYVIAAVELDRRP